MEALTGSNCDQQKFRETKSLVRFFDVLSTNKDRNGLEFISTIEGTLPNWSLNGICYYLPASNSACWSISSSYPKDIKLENISNAPLPVFNSLVQGLTGYPCCRGPDLLNVNHYDNPT